MMLLLRLLQTPLAPQLLVTPPRPDDDGDGAFRDSGNASCMRHYGPGSLTGPDRM